MLLFVFLVILFISNVRKIWLRDRKNLVKLVGLGVRIVKMDLMWFNSLLVIEKAKIYHHHDIK
jgi:uncharacterized membrane protein